MPAVIITFASVIMLILRIIWCLTNIIILVNEGFVKSLIVFANKLTILIVLIGSVIARCVLRRISVGHNSSHRVINVIVSAEIHIENCIRHLTDTISVISEILNEVILIKLSFLHTKSLKCVNRIGGISLLNIVNLIRAGLYCVTLIRITFI